MGMIGKLYLVSAEAAEQLVDDPTGVLALLGLDDDFDYDVDDESDQESDDKLDLGKSWHGLHFLLNGSASDGEPPLNFLVAGGEEIGIDLGSGQVRIFDAAAVKRIDAALGNLSRDELLGRLDPEAFDDAGVYPGGHRNLSLKRLQRKYGNAFDRLKVFMSLAASSGRSLVATIL